MSNNHPVRPQSGGEKTEPIRVLHVIRVMDRGGAEAMIMNLYRRIDRDAIQFDFMVHTEEPGAHDAEITKLGGRIYRAPAFWGYNIPSYRRSWEEHLRHHPEHQIIHGHLTSSAAVYLAIARRFSRVTIAHSHSSSHGPGLLGLGLFLYTRPIRRYADLLFACSLEAGWNMFGQAACETESFFVVPNAIDTQAYRFNPTSRDVIRAEFGMQDSFVVGHIGRFDEAKNQRFLIAILPHLRQIDSRAELLLIGDGPSRQTTQALVAEQGLSEHVRFAGVRADSAALLSGMDFFCFPSIHEGLPLALVEAQASGLPCLISDSIPPQAHITDLVESMSLTRSPDAWAEAIAQRPRPIDRVSGDSTRQVDAAGYDVRKTAQMISDLYLKLASRTLKTSQVAMN